MFSHIKNTDLNFAGISKGFASIGRAPMNTPSGDSVMKGSYDREDVHVPLIDGRTLHAVLGGSNGIKLTLVDGKNPTSTNGVEIGWISAEVMKKAIAVDHGLLRVDGNDFVFANVPRPLKRMLITASA